jgi:hypothetical protein
MRHSTPISVFTEISPIGTSLFHFHIFPIYLQLQTVTKSVKKDTTTIAAYRLLNNYFFVKVYKFFIFNFFNLQFASHYHQKTFLSELQTYQNLKTESVADMDEMSDYQFVKK